MGEFKRIYQKPIELGHFASSTAKEVQTSKKLSNILRNKIDYWILRRTNMPEGVEEDDNSELNLSSQKEPSKHDYVLWCKLTDTQLKIYKDVVTMRYGDLRVLPSSMLSLCTVAQMICDHPRRISENACLAAGFTKRAITSVDTDGFEENVPGSVHFERLLSESGKMSALFMLIDVIFPKKILIFSRSTKNLDIIASVLAGKSIMSIRVDGSINRTSRVNRLNEFSKFDENIVMLMSTSLGSDELPVASASRVIIFEPDWNPIIDENAVARARQIDQPDTIVVFRLVTCDTIEEKIYNRQLLKMSTIRQNNWENDDLSRHFDMEDMVGLLKPPMSTAGNMSSGTQKRFASKETDNVLEGDVASLLQKIDDLKEFHAGYHNHRLALDENAVDQTPSDVNNCSSICTSDKDNKTTSESAIFYVRELDSGLNSDLSWIYNENFPRKDDSVGPKRIIGAKRGLNTVHDDLTLSSINVPTKRVSSYSNDILIQRMNEMKLYEGRFNRETHFPHAVTSDRSEKNEKLIMWQEAEKEAGKEIDKYE